MTVKEKALWAAFGLLFTGTLGVILVQMWGVHYAGEPLADLADTIADIKKTLAAEAASLTLYLSHLVGFNAGQSSAPTVESNDPPGEITQ